ncbi:MAG: DUF2288 domain-containing protein [Thioalkalispiraceae bacterium]|jgi:hypothetical protein
MNDERHNKPELDIKQKLNLDTGKLSWPDLQTFFARGVVIVVSPELDLIEIAAQLSDDNAQAIDRLIQSGQIIRAHDDHARAWVETEPTFWAVVVSPWVLVQEITH